jgi:hypothetical protein
LYGKPGSKANIENDKIMKFCEGRLDAKEEA